MGMFSTLGKLMGIPLEDALKELPIAQEIKDALLKHEGRSGLLYDVIISYEKADWKKMSASAAELDIPLNIITQKYFECVEFVNTTWNGLMQANPNAVDDEE